MLIGDPHSFGIECHHEPIPNETGRVFGRMCVFAEGWVLGDINEPACMLNVTEGHLSGVVRRLSSLDDKSLAGLSDREAFDRLNRAVYLDDGRSGHEVQQDAECYFRFDFLTNGGESFDGTKSFIVLSGGYVRVLFTDNTGEFRSAHVPIKTFSQVVSGFFAWIESEGRNAVG